MPKKSSGMQKILFLNRISPQKINKPKITFYSTVRSTNIHLANKKASEDNNEATEDNST
jgi:hypothetical protein